jgi:rhamnogalacturonyl hydrolase YesR
MGLLDVIETVGVGDARAAVLEDSLARLAHAMVASQRPDGHWGSLTTEESPAETSAAAFFAAALMRMRRLGLGNDETDAAGARAFDAMMGSVDDLGQLRGVSATVWSSTQLDHYKHVPMDHMVPWSQGPLLMALHEDELAKRQ